MNETRSVGGEEVAGISDMECGTSYLERVPGIREESFAFSSSLCSYTPP